MRKINQIVLITLILVVVLIGSLLFWNSIFNARTQIIIINNNYNDNPVDKYHASVFNVINSNYLEKNYERYLSYKEKNPSLSDDEIITNVNIGLDNKFYTNIRSSNLEDGILVLCNKYNKLPKDYVPKLVNMNSNYSKSGGKLHPEAYEAFKEMVDDAKGDGIKLYNVSAYRSYSTQSYLYNRYKDRDGITKADTYSARPGHSEHQTGLATDINTASSSVHFENTKEYAWLIKNSYKYGFILRYPEGKTYITGYKYEPWHYRYVGREAAKYIYENNITYEEYYAKFLETN